MLGLPQHPITPIPQHLFLVSDIMLESLLSQSLTLKLIRMGLRGKEASVPLGLYPSGGIVRGAIPSEQKGKKG